MNRMREMYVFVFKLDELDGPGEEYVVLCLFVCLLSYVYVFKLDELDELNVCAMQLLTVATLRLPFILRWTRQRLL